MAAGNSTLHDVAKLAGVSTATVNRVLKGGYVSADARSAVETALKETGYRPNSMARGLRMRRSYTIGQMLTEITVNPFFANVAQGVENAARTNNYRTVLFNHSNDSKRERLGIERFIDDQVDAVLFCTSTASTNLALLDRSGIPYIELERSRTMTAPFVRADNYTGARQAMVHLVELGHRRIAFVGGDPAIQLPNSRRGYAVEEERLNAYRDCVQQFDLIVDPRLVRLGEYYSMSDAFPGAAGYRHMRALLDLDQPPTAVFATCDILAAGALQAIYDRRLRIPEDISIVGFDDTLAVCLAPALTTVSQPMARMGAAGFQCALDLIEGRTPPAEQTLPAELVVRNSTGRAPS